MTLRPYQQDAADAAISWLRSCTDPCVIGAPTGAGKSHIIASIAGSIHSMSGKSVLCLAPSGELVKQNYGKYKLTGNKASVFSASVGRKETRFPVVFGSPLTVANTLVRFDNRYAAVIVDEAHGITPTLKKIIDSMRAANPLLRVIGLSATPYRLGSGYIYQHHYAIGRLDESVARDPYFHTMVYDIDARQLIDEGYLTPPAMEQGPDQYDTSGLAMTPSGRWSAETVDRAFEGHGRRTASIVADIVARSASRKGVMIFGSTIRHATEILASLPQSLSAIVTGDTKKSERERILKAFLARKIKYLVNVAVLTTGFDAPHVDVIAILRATESVGLLQQIIGRGLRVDAGKTDCLVLDYAENIERHCPGGDLFAPEIKATSPLAPGEPIRAECPACGYENEFSPRQNPDGYQIDINGHFVDPLGDVVQTEHGPMPAHHGRRCQGESVVSGVHVRCSHMWAHKQCPECGVENDIAARHCRACKAEIIDPNEKLIEIAAAIARDPYRTRTANITAWTLQRWPGKDGKPDSVRVVYSIDETPHSLSHWLAPLSNSSWLRSKWHAFCMSAWGESVDSIDEAIEKFNCAKMPSVVTFRKKQGSKFFDVVSTGDKT